MLICNFPKIANLLLKDLPKNDYPVLNTFLFVSCWLGLIMDQSLTGMTDLITRLNNRDIKVHLSTFSKASLNRSDEIFQKILHKAMIELQKKKGKSKNKILFPLDSTIITLTSKLLWKRGYHQVKLFCGLNDWTSGVAGILINFGQGNDSKYGNHTIDSIPENGIGIMDRGFCSKIRISELLQKENQFFVLRIKNNITLKFLENNKFLIGTTKQVETRLINFCDLDNKTEYRLVTNLKESEINDDEIREISRKRWAIETLWKFLKMHLKLDKLITRNENGIRIQIYSCLIVYILLQLIDIPEEIGKKSLDKLRYLQSFMSENISYIHWFKRMSYSW